MTNYYKDGDLIQPPRKIIRKLKKENASNYFFKRLGLEPKKVNWEYIPTWEEIPPIKLLSLAKILNMESIN